MKTKLKMIVLLMFCFISTIHAQEPDNERDKKMMDSIMGMIPEDQRGVVEQVMKMAEEADKERRTKKKPKPDNTTVQKTTGHLDHMMITRGNQKKFDNWPYGNADIFLVARSYDGKDLYEYKVGEFNAEGLFDMTNTWPEIPTETSINKFFDCQMQGVETAYSNEKAKIIKGYIEVRKGEGQLGTLHIASSKQAAWNNSPAAFYRGDTGFYVELYHVSEPVTVSGKCDYERRATDHAEIIEQIQVTDIYDINFEKGLNLVKHEVTASKNVGRIPYYTSKKVWILNNNDPKARWVFSEHK